MGVSTIDATIDKKRIKDKNYKKEGTRCKNREFIRLWRTPLTRDVYRMVLVGDTAAITAPGQFVNIRIEGCYLRRPISVADWDENTLTLIYKVVGEGTKRLSRMGGPGAALDLLVGLGNGYDLSCCGKVPVLLGGGVGVPPLYGLAKRLWQRGITPTVLLGFGRAEEVFCEQEFRAGLPTMVATEDGSYGYRGLSPICCGKPGCGMITFIPAARRDAPRGQKPAAAADS